MMFMVVYYARIRIVSNMQLAACGRIPLKTSASSIIPLMCDNTSEFVQCTHCNEVLETACFYLSTLRSRSVPNICKQCMKAIKAKKAADAHVERNTCKKCGTFDELGFVRVEGGTVYKPCGDCSKPRTYLHDRCRTCNHANRTYIAL